MFGFTSSAFQPDNFCYIVIYTPVLDHEEIEFLEGKVKKLGAVLPRLYVAPDHPILRFSEPTKIQAICATTTHDFKAQRLADDPIKINQEPGRPYLVVSPPECVRYLQSQGDAELALKYASRALEHCQQDLERNRKMNGVQLRRIRSLEATIQRYSKQKL